MTGRWEVYEAFMLSGDAGHTIREPRKTSCLSSVFESGSFPVTGRDDISARS